jgi:hypothetical protein
MKIFFIVLCLSFLTTSTGIAGEKKPATHKKPKPSLAEKLACVKDSDCGCGVDKSKQNCAYGNKKYIDETKQCPDFCTGFDGASSLRCVAKKCALMHSSSSE